MSFFSVRVYRYFIFLFIGLILLTFYHRTEHFDDAWFAEQSYWFLKDGKVRSELFRGFLHWDERIYIFHKLFIYTGAFLMGLVGFSVAGSKLIGILFGVIAAGLIWKYMERGSREQQGLALLLYLACGTLIKYFCINRPETMCMTLGFASYLCLDRPNGRAPSVVWAGVLAGLAALTHLNGLMYLAAGTLWLLVRTDWRKTFAFASVGSLVLSLYLLDALLDQQMDRMVWQFVEDPAMQYTRTLADKLKVMVNYHQLFFHSHHEAALTALVLLTVLFGRKHLSLTQPIVLYLTLLVVLFWLVTKSTFAFYILLFVPWFVILVATYAPAFIVTRVQQRIAQGIITVYVVIGLITIGEVLYENYTVPYQQTYNEQLTRFMPEKNSKVIAPLSFFFGQMENYRIRSLSYYCSLRDRPPLTLPEFFEMARQEGVKYIISDNPLNSSYSIPLDTPERMGAYTQVCKDERTVVYQYNP
ncbi:ArnT family glycosyltransferase [Siphonobacter sp.]|uniref:ArnT family glycosyltransferase n=1 Tax=Siphonobacter sp. TaxID=1869184 RepID=UPI003B3AE470